MGGVYRGGHDDAGDAEHQGPDAHPRRSVRRPVVGTRRDFIVLGLDGESTVAEHPPRRQHRYAECQQRNERKQVVDFALGLRDHGRRSVRGMGRCAEYLQAGRSADRLTVEVSRPDGGQWNCQWVRYVVGHAHDPDLALDVDIPMPHGAQRVSAAEVFEPEEAADVFVVYHQTGDLPDDYVLRPVQGYIADGTAVELSEDAT